MKLNIWDLLQNDLVLGGEGREDGVSDQSLYHGRMSFHCSHLFPLLNIKLEAIKNKVKEYLIKSRKYS